MDAEGNRKNEKLRGDRDEKKAREKIRVNCYINIGRCTERMAFTRTSVNSYLFTFFII